MPLKPLLFAVEFERPMKVFPVVRPSTLTIAIFSFATVLSSAGRAERVGYQFCGQMIPPLLLPGKTLPENYNIFNVAVPLDAPVRGTFSYDTTSAGKDSVDNSKVFAQEIQGGLTFDILGPDGNPLLHIVASQSTMTATNDFLPAKTPSPIDAFSVALIPPPAPFFANGASISRSTATINIPFNWDEATFTGPDQPYLWPDLPPISYRTIGVIGTLPTKSVPNSLGSFELDSLKKLQPGLGDYNFNGAIDDGDDSEWRDAFGDTDSFHHYADGNDDGLVDGADYVLWRNAMSHSGASSTSVPEPSVISIALMASIGVASVKRRRK